MAIKKTNSTSTATALVPPPGSLDGAGGTNELRAIKPPVDIPLGPWPWIVGALALSLVGLLVWLWLRRQRRVRPAAPEVVVPPHVRAKQKLEQALGLISDPRLFCIAVSDATRVYLEERFELRAPDRTTEEFLLELQRTNHLFPDQKTTLGQFLEQCDLVKFARSEPTENELRALHRIADRLVDETLPTAIGASESSPAQPLPPPVPSTP